MVKTGPAKKKNVLNKLRNNTILREILITSNGVCGAIIEPILPNIEQNESKL